MQGECHAKQSKLHPQDNKKSFLTPKALSVSNNNIKRLQH